MVKRGHIGDIRGLMPIFSKVFLTSSQRGAERTTIIIIFYVIDEK